MESSDVFASYMTSMLLCFFGFCRAFRGTPEFSFTWTQAAIATFITIMPGINMMAALILIFHDLNDHDTARS